MKLAKVRKSWQTMLRIVVLAVELKEVKKRAPVRMLEISAKAVVLAERKKARWSAVEAVFVVKVIVRKVISGYGFCLR